MAIDFGDQFSPLLSVWADLGMERPTFRALAERAGLNAENTDACPCFCGGTFREGDPATCLTCNASHTAAYYAPPSVVGSMMFKPMVPWGLEPLDPVTVRLMGTASKREC